MSVPVLYEANTTNFFNKGLGTLPDALTAVVTEERNGEFIFEMTYPADGARSGLLENNRIIKVDAGHVLTDQRFVIKKTTPQMSEDGKIYIDVYAEHISYITNDLALKPSVTVSGSANDAMQQWQKAIIDSNEITADSDISTNNSTAWTIDKVQNARLALGGVDGSILDVWGGEYLFDNLHISLRKQRGSSANALLAYGRNITSFQQEENIEDTYTSIYPYATLNSASGDTSSLYTINNYVVDSQYVGNYPNRKILPVDFSSNFENVKVGTKASDASDSDTTVYMTVAEVQSQLKALAQQYITNNDVGIPTVSISVSFVDLSKTSNYADVAPLEQLDLCDIVPVRFTKLGIDTTAKVTHAEWNVLTDSYDKIELGSITPTLGQTLNTLTTVAQAAKQVAQDAQNNATIAWQSADGKTTTFKGSSSQDFPTAQHIGDLYWRENGDTTEVYIWDGSEWAFQFSNKTGQNISKAVDKAMAEADTATKNANAAVETGNQALTKAQAGIDTANAAADNASTAMSNSSTAINNARSAMTDASSAVDSANSAMTKATTALSTANSSSDIANAVQQQVTKLKDGSTMTIADLANGLALRLVKKDLDGYATQSWASDQITTTADAINVNLTKVQNQVNDSAVGTNLLTNSSFSHDTGYTSWNVENSPTWSTNKAAYMEYTGSSTASPNYSEVRQTVGGLTVGEWYTLQFNILYCEANTTFHLIAWNSSENHDAAFTSTKAGDVYGVKAMTFQAQSTSLTFYLRVYSGGLNFSQGKLEKGAVATDWCLNPAEQATQSYVSTTLEATATSLTANLESYTDTKSINVLNSAKSYADTQIKATADGLQTQVISIKKTADKATTDITTLNQRASGWDSTIYSLKQTKADQSWTTNQIKASADSLNVNISKVQTQVNNSAVGTNLFSDNLVYQWLGTTGNSYERTDKGFSFTIPAGGSTGVRFLKVLSNNTTNTANSSNYTVSGKIKATSALLFEIDICDDGQNDKFNVGTDWQSFSFTRNATSYLGSPYYGFVDFQLAQDALSSDVTIYLDELKIEKGTKATDWSANPTDNATVTSVTNLSITLDGIKQTVAQKVDNNTFSSYQNQTATLIGSKVASNDFNSYKTQTDNALSQRVTSSAFSSYQTQTDSAIQQRVTSATYSAGITTLSNQINSKVSQNDWANSAVGANLLTNSSFSHDTSYTSWNVENSPTWSSNNIAYMEYTGSSTADPNYSEVRQTVGGLTVGEWYTLQFNILYCEANTTFHLIAWNSSENHDAAFTSTKAGDVYGVKTMTFQAQSTSLTFYLRVYSGGLNFSQGKLEKGSNATPWCPAASEIANYSQIQQLSDNINLRVVKNDVINQINLSTEGILIDGKRTHITGQTVIDNAVIKSAMVDTLSADKVTFGTLNGNLVDVTNINADNITAGTLTGVAFHQSSSGHDTWIDGNGIHDYDSSGNNAWIQKGILQVYNKDGNGFFMDGGKLQLTSQYLWHQGGSVKYGLIELDNDVLALGKAGMHIQGYNGLRLDTGHSMFDSLTGVIDNNYTGAAVNLSDDGQIVIGCYKNVYFSAGAPYTIGGIVTQKPNIDIGTSSWDDNSTTGRGMNIVMQANGIKFDTNGEIKLNAGSNLWLGSAHINTGGDTNTLYSGPAGGWWMRDYTGALTTVHCQSVSQSSLLSLKTNLNKLDGSNALSALVNTDIYSYNYKSDLKNGISKTYATPIIDDVNTKPKYNMPYDFISADGTGRDDGTILGYAVAAIQELNSKIGSLKEEIKQLKENAA